MASFIKGRSTRKTKEPKELLAFFRKDYSAVKVSKNKILGTAQQLTGLRENTWVNVDIGDQDPWKGLVIKTGQTRNELGRCEIAFLAFLNQQTNDQENIPLNEFFTQQKDNESDEEEFFHEVETMTKEKMKKKTIPKKIAVKRPRDHDDSAAIQNKNEKKQKRDQAKAQALASKKQSDEILKSLENIIKETAESDHEMDVHSDLESDIMVTDAMPKQAALDIKSQAESKTKHPNEPIIINADATLESGSIVHKLQEMLATSMRGIHERFDSMEKAIQALVEQQKTNEKKLEELMASKVLKSKTSRPLNLVVSHSPLNTCSGSTLVTTQPLESTPEKQKEAENLEQKSSPASAEKVDTGYIGHRKFGITASLSVIKRAEEQARGVPKSLAFNLLNILVDAKTQAESNISGQNGKKALDKNILGAIQSHLASQFEWSEEESELNWKRKPVNMRQRIADKCRNLNKKKKN
ncbi:uncharacterized protein LOC141885807 [Acropora palmata]|uniref:uncharacterized protein LOC141885807 n=1 Tax=Acropora palmata TaxID=6131 RepID=UPI003DA16845